MKKYYFLVFLVLFPVTAIADDNQIIDNIDINLSNGAYLTVASPQNFTEIDVFDNTEGTNSSYFLINLNNSNIKFNSNFNRTISIISYNQATDTWVWNVVNTGVGYLRIVSHQSLSNTRYDMFVDGIYVDAQTSDSDGITTFIYSFTGASNNRFIIFSEAPYVPPIAKLQSSQPNILFSGSATMVLIAFFAILTIVFILLLRGLNELSATGMVVLILWVIVAIVFISIVLGGIVASSIQNFGMP